MSGQLDEWMHSSQSVRNQAVKAVVHWTNLLPHQSLFFNHFNTK